MEIEIPTKKKDRLITLAGSCLIYFTIGLIYSWGSIGVYIRQYVNSLRDRSFSQDEYNIIFPVALSSLVIGNLFGPHIFQTKGIRVTALISAFGMAFALFLTSIVQTYYLTVTCFGALLGFFCGIPYSPPMGICQTYFPRQKGLIAGICMMFLGFSSLVISLIIVTIINPDDIQSDQNHNFPPSVYNNVPKALRIIAVYCLVVCSIGGFMIRIPEKQSLLLSQSNIENEEQESFICQKTLLKKPLLYLCIIMFSFTVSTGFAILSTFKQIGSSFDDRFLTLIIGNIASFSNGSFRLIFGWLYDRYKFRIVYSSMCVINIIICFSLYQINESKGYFTLYILLAAAVEGGHFSIFPTFVLENFGVQHGPAIYTKVMISVLIGNFGQEFLFIYFQNVENGSRTVFNILGGFSFLSLIVANFIVPKFILKKPRESSLVVYDNSKLLIDN